MCRRRSSPDAAETAILAYFSTENVKAAPSQISVPPSRSERRPKRALRFSKQQVNVARRRQLAAQARASGQNLRAAVEATVRSVKHPFRNGKVPVRGQPRVSMLVIGSAAMSNVRRIWRYLQAKNKPESQEKSRKIALGYPCFSFFVSLFTLFFDFPGIFDSSGSRTGFC